MDFAERLIQYREAHNLTQEALAERLGISRRMLYKYEAGISVPRASTLKKICDELHISSDAMLGKKSSSRTPSRKLIRWYMMYRRFLPAVFFPKKIRMH